MINFSAVRFDNVHMAELYTYTVTHKPLYYESIANTPPNIDSEAIRARLQWLDQGRWEFDLRTLFPWVGLDNSIYIKQIRIFCGTPNISPSALTISSYAKDQNGNYQTTSKKLCPNFDVSTDAESYVLIPKTSINIGQGAPPTLYPPVSIGVSGVYGFYPAYGLQRDCIFSYERHAGMRFTDGLSTFSLCPCCEITIETDAEKDPEPDPDDPSSPDDGVIDNIPGIPEATLPDIMPDGDHDAAYATGFEESEGETSDATIDPQTLLLDTGALWPQYRGRAIIITSITLYTRGGTIIDPLVNNTGAASHACEVVDEGGVLAVTWRTSWPMTGGDIATASISPFNSHAQYYYYTRPSVTGARIISADARGDDAVCIVTIHIPSNEEDDDDDITPGTPPTIPSPERAADPITLTGMPPMMRIDLDNLIHSKRISSARLNELIFDTGTFELVYPMGDIGDAAPLEAGQWYDVAYQGKSIFRGIAKSPRAQISASSKEYVWVCVICDPYDLLERSQCLTVTQDGGIHPGLMIDLDAGNIALGQAVRGILGLAGNNGLPIKYSVSGIEDGLIIPWSVSVASYGGMLRDAVKWQPELASRWDYSGDMPVLRISSRSSMPRVTLDIDDVDNRVLEGIALEARHDLVPSCVGMTAMTVAYTEQGMPYTHALSCVYPVSGDVRKPDALVQWLGVVSSQQLRSQASKDEEDGETEIAPTGSPGGWQYTKGAPYMTIKGKKIPTSPGGMATWLKERLGWGDSVNLAIGKAKMEVLEGSSNATKYELVEGFISKTVEKKGVRWAKVRHTIAIVHTGRPPVELKEYFPRSLGNNNYGGILSIEVITTNVRNKAYRHGGDYRVWDADGETSTPEDETTPEYNPYAEDTLEKQMRYFSTIYPDMCKRLYESTRTVPWEGSLPLIGVHDVRLGSRINLEGGIKAWETMDAIVYSRSIDFISKSTELQVGPAHHLGLQDQMSRYDAMQQKRQQAVYEAKEVKETKEAVKEEQQTIEYSFGPKDDDTAKNAAAGISPSFAVVSQSGAIAEPEGWQARVAYDKQGNAVGFEYMGGWAQVGTKKQWIGPEKWTYTDKTGKFYLVLEGHYPGAGPNQYFGYAFKGGKITQAEVEEQEPYIKYKGGSDAHMDYHNGISCHLLWDVTKEGNDITITRHAAGTVSSQYYSYSSDYSEAPYPG